MRIDRIRLVTEMAKKDMTGKRLATLSGLSRVTITGVKTGKTCAEETAKKIAKALNVDVEEIIQKED